MRQGPGGGLPNTVARRSAKIISTLDRTEGCSAATVLTPSGMSSPTLPISLIAIACGPARPLA
jgi:hypothetical protein